MLEGNKSLSIGSETFKVRRHIDEDDPNSFLIRFDVNKHVRLGNVSAYIRMFHSDIEILRPSETIKSKLQFWVHSTTAIGSWENC